MSRHRVKRRVAAASIQAACPGRWRAATASPGDAAQRRRAAKRLATSGRIVVASAADGTPAAPCRHGHGKDDADDEV